MAAGKQLVSKVSEHNKSEEWRALSVGPSDALPWNNWYQNNSSIDKDVFANLQRNL